MAFKMKNSALKNILRGPGPHNDAHRGLGDNSDKAHSDPNWQKHYETSDKYTPPKKEEKEKPLTGKMVCKTCGYLKTDPADKHPGRHVRAWVDSSKI